MGHGMSLEILVRIVGMIHRRLHMSLDILVRIVEELSLELFMIFLRRGRQESVIPVFRSRQRLYRFSRFLVHWVEN